METRANHVWVGLVSLLMMGALLAFIIWLVGFGDGNRKEYDIFFPQSVEGLVKGSQVTFSGVPVGQVERLNLWAENPEFVQVRIGIDPDVPVLLGTTATVLGSFTGVSTIQLDGARAGQPPITRIGRDGRPEIQPKVGGLGAILSSAPQLLESLSALTERLTALISPRNQQSIEEILANTSRLSGELAQASPDIRGVAADLRATIQQSTLALASLEKTLNSTDNLINSDGEALIRELRDTLISARKAAEALDATMTEVQPAARQLSEGTLPAAEAALRDLRKTTAALRQVTESLEAGGAGALIGGQTLPDYKP